MELNRINYETSVFFAQMNVFTIICPNIIFSQMGKTLSPSRTPTTKNLNDFFVSGARRRKNRAMFVASESPARAKWVRGPSGCDVWIIQVKS